MSLVVCPECQGNVSERAVTCVHCGFPLGSRSTQSQTPPSPKKTEPLTPRQFGRGAAYIAFPYGVMEVGKFLFGPVAESSSLQFWIGLALMIPGALIARRMIWLWLVPFGIALWVYARRDSDFRSPSYLEMGIAILMIVIPLVVNWRRLQGMGTKAAPSGQSPKD